MKCPAKNAANDKQIVDAVNNGTLDIKVLDTAVERILNIVLKYTENKQSETKIDFEADHEEARKIADESMVLLKNDGILPLKRSQKLAFIGKFAETPRFQGGGSSHVNSYKVTSALEAAKGLDVTYAPGYDTNTTESDEALLKEAQEAAKNADVAVVFVGITDAMESEGMDRRTLSMPKNHEALVKAVSEVQKNTVVVVMCGGCITMPWIDDVRGVLYAYLGGEAVGTATLDLLFGDVNPSGKLAETFPRRLEDNPSYLYFFGDEQNKTEYREGVFVGYRYYDKKNMDVLFPFGYGLSYTTFAYSNLTVKQENGEVIATVNVQNTGALDGDEVVQLYMSLPGSLRVRPIHALKAFKRVHIKAGETVTVTLNFKIDDLAIWCNGRKIYTVESGVYKNGSRRGERRYSPYRRRGDCRRSVPGSTGLLQAGSHRCR